MKTIIQIVIHEDGAIQGPLFLGEGLHIYEAQRALHIVMGQLIERLKPMPQPVPDLVPEPTETPAEGDSTSGMG